MLNVDLWKRLDKAIERHEMEWHWVKGHAGHDENERCDELAKAAAQSPKRRYWLSKSHQDKPESNNGEYIINQVDYV